MKVTNVLKSFKQLRVIQGVEKELRSRKVNSKISLLVVIASGVYEVVFALSGNEEFNDLIKKLTDGSFLEFLRSLTFNYATAGILVFIVFLLLYFALSKTRFLLREAREPFKYTLWIEPFVYPAGNGSLTEHDKHAQLHYFLYQDLREKLVERFKKRLSLLDVDQLSLPAEADLSSHINIRGNFSFRDMEATTEGNDLKHHAEKKPTPEEEVISNNGEKKSSEIKNENATGRKVLIVTPQLRIGGKTNPEILMRPVKYELPNEIGVGIDENLEKIKLRPSDYKYVVERVYSRVASEIYSQIKLDLTKKVRLFPTNFLRAVAYYNEAEDFARSNTIDAYDYAIELYNEALRYFDISIRAFYNKFILKIPFIRWGVKFNHMWAKTHIGYAKCLLYRRQISALSGRYKNPLFEIPDNLSTVVRRLITVHNKINKLQWGLYDITLDGQGEVKGLNVPEKIAMDNRLNSTMAFLSFKKDSLLKIFKINKDLFDSHRLIFFDAYVVLAMTFNYLGVHKKARDFLKNAKSIAPALSERNALYLLATGEIEPDLERKIPYFTKASELAPDFQIAQYLLANCYEMLFRKEDEITKERVEGAIKHYDRVLELNPGNIASLVSQGNLYWMVSNHEMAVSKFEQGKEVKAIVQQTFIVEILYGLAKVEAERGNINKSYEYFAEAISADPGVAAYSTSTLLGKSNSPYFELIGPNLLRRYYKFKETCEEKIERTVKFNEEDIENVDELIKQLNDVDKPLMRQIFKLFSENLQKLLCRYHDVKFLKSSISKKLIDEFNWLIRDDGNKIKNDDKENFYNALSNEYGKNNISDFKDAEKEGLSSAEKRKLLEKLFSGNLKIKGQVVPLESVESAPGNIKESTKNTVLSWVLNDYGNACFNYYLRFGFNQTVELERAILAYEQSLKLTPNNKVTLYNLANAYDYNLGNYDLEKQFRLFEKVINIGTTWHTANIWLIKFGLSLFTKRETDLKDKIVRFEERKEKMDEKIKLLQDPSQGEGNEQSDAFRNLTPTEGKYQGEVLKSRVTNTFRQDMVESPKARTGDDLEQIPLERDQFISGQISNLRRDIIDAEGKIKQFKEDLSQIPIEREMFISGKVKEIIENTKLSSLLVNPRLKNDSENVVFLVNKIEKDRLDESDIEALVVWAEAMSHKSGNELARNNAKKVCEIILNKYHIDSMEINMIIRGLYLRQLENVVESMINYEEGNQNEVYFNESEFDKHEELKIIISRIDYYNCKLNSDIALLNQNDPEHFFYKRVSNFILNNDIGGIFYRHKIWDKAKNYFTTALEWDFLYDDVSRSNVHANLGDVFLELEFYDEASKQYLKAIKAAPNCGKSAFQMAYMLFQNGENDKAIHYFKRAIEYNATVAHFHTFMGLNYHVLGKNLEAEFVLEKAVELDSQNDVYLNELGKALYENKKYYQSILCHKNAIKINNNNIEYHSKLGLAYKAQNKFDLAEAAFRQVLKLNILMTANGQGFKIDNDEALDNILFLTLSAEKKKKLDAININDIGDILYKKKKFEKALQFYETALKIDNKNAEFLINYILTLEHLKKFKQANDALEDAFKNNFNSEVELIDLGSHFYKRINDKMAIKCYKQALKLVDDNSHLFASLCLAYIGDKNYKAAGQSIKKAIELSPQNAVYYDYQGIVEINNKDYEAAAKCYTKAIELDPTKAWYRVKLIAVYDLLKESKKADELIIEAVKLDAKNPTYLNDLGNAYYKIKYYTESKKCFEQAVENDPLNPVYNSNLGLAYKQLWADSKYGTTEDYNQSVNYFNRAIELEPSNSLYYNDMGNLLNLNREYEKAIDYYKTAIEYEPGNAIYYANIGLMHSQIAKTSRNDDEINMHYKAALEYYEKASAEEQYYSDYHYYMAIILNDQGDNRKALNQLDKAMAIDDSKAEYVAEYGLSYRKMNCWDESARFYLEAAKLEPQNANYWNSAGLAKYYKKDYKSAIELYNRAIDLNPKLGTYYNNLGLALEQLGDIEAAISNYYLAIDHDYDKADLIYNTIGYTYFKQEKYAAAVTSYNEALKIEPDNYVYLGNIAKAYDESDQIMEAERSFVQAIEKKPDDTINLNEFGKFWLKHAQYKKAIKIFTNLVNLYPKIGEYQFSLGTAYFKDGQYELASKQLAYALQLEPDKIKWKVLLASAYIHLQKLKEAEYELEEAINLQPKHADTHYEFGNLYLKKEQYSVAKDHFQQALDINKQDPSYYAGLYEAMSRGENEEAAETMLQEVISKNLTDKNFIFNLGFHLFYFNVSMAEYCFEKVLKSKHQNADFLLTLGKLYADVNELELSSDYYQRLLKLDPYLLFSYIPLIQNFGKLNNIEAADKVFNSLFVIIENELNHLIDFGNEFFNLKFYQYSIECYQQATLIDRLNSNMHFYLFDTLRIAKYFKEAEVALQKALKIGASNADFSYKMGIQLMKAKYLNEAIEFVQLAVQRNPDNLNYLDLLGLSYLDANMNEAAANIYLKLINLSDNQIYKDSFKEACEKIEDPAVVSSLTNQYNALINTGVISNSGPPT